MVETQLVPRGIREPALLKVMARTPRHKFVPDYLRTSAYADGPLPIGGHQTISQPYIVALMTEVLTLTGKERVLEIGTGSGYQTAILCQLARSVFTIEINPELSASARCRLNTLNFTNFKCREGNGHRGWPEAAPFDRILITAAPNEIPTNLYHQVTRSGRIVLPVGAFSQDLLVITQCHDENPQIRKVLPVRFVPMADPDC
ncbi:MAG: protein-L-isoaspartate(D-aspartate) O-methyltransferase [FCB group bacterium]|nr:protein-L-isoaspartate(D-aspartate) O-methyltransferase [FCB group bacterium]